MKRLLAIFTVLVAAATVLVFGTGADDGGGGGYRVRAIFDNAVSVIPGEDVKVAGVKVGKIASLDVTGRAPDVKAAVVLSITAPGFHDFRADAECTIRPQSLIGEKYVECTPTQPRAPGSPVPGPLPKIEHGAGQGQHLIPVSQTHTPVDIDLISNIVRRPYAERLSIFLSELGTGVAGRGQDLDQLIRRANPALQQTDKVLKLLAGQNAALANLARDSDAVLAPLSRDRRQVADFFVQANTVAQAAAERGDALEANFRKLPRFLTELRPTVQRLGALSDQAAPVFEDLGSQARSINRFVKQLGPFSQAAIPALRTLGRATDFGTPAVVALRPTLQDLRIFAARARPVGANLAALTTSLRDSGGIERLLDYLFFQATAVNGFDQFGHYLRAALLLSKCSVYVTTPVAGCSANFSSAGTASRGVAGDDPSLQRVAAALRGVPQQPARRGRPSGKTTKPATGGQAPAQGPTGQPSSPAPAPAPAQAPAPARPAGSGSPQKTPAPAPSDPTQGLLNYLLGSDGR
jgi:phospholipid/cholesterol/gamma-HCH transport system substrate-binding protein